MTSKTEAGVEQEADEPGEESESLLERLARVPDPRSRHGRRYPVGVLLGIAVAAVLSGAKTYTGGRGVRRGAVPGAVGRAGVHPAVLGGQVSGAWGDRAASAVAAAGCRGAGSAGGRLAGRATPRGDASAVAVDGKCLRGALGPDGRRVHLLAALLHGHGAVVAQRRVAAKTSEIGAFAPLLDDVELTGRVVTADSLHTQRAHARYLVEDRDAAYLLVVKGNQAGMVTAIDRMPEQAFSPTAPDG